MRIIAAFIVFLCAPVVWAQTAGAPVELITQCSDEADPRSVGLQALEIECPGLEHALVELGYAPFISEAQASRLSIHGLTDLAALSRRHRGSDASSADLDLTALDSILTAIEQARSERPKSWFERLGEWLRTIMRRQQSAQDSWFSRWLEDVEVPAATTRAITYGLVLLVMVLAIAVLVNELRAAGVLKRKRRTHTGFRGTSEMSAPAEPQLADVDTAPLRERASVLLRLLIAALSRSGRLRADRSLTHRELAGRASFDEMPQRERFRQVAALAERMLYGVGPIVPDEVDRVLRDGRALHAELNMPRGPRT